MNIVIEKNIMVPMRLHYRHSFTQPTLINSGDIVEAQIDLWNTANVFRAGHCIRVEVSSSCFPKFARNSNTGGAVAGEALADYRTTTNTVYHRVYSDLILPVRKRS